MATGIFGWNPIKFAADVVGDKDVIPGYDPFTNRQQAQPDKPVVNLTPFLEPLSTIGEDSGSTGGSSSYGSSSPSYSAEDLAYLDSQAGTLQSQLGRTDTTLANALAKIINEYNREQDNANLTRSRNLEDFNIKTQVSEAGRSRELGKVDTSARMLANSLRQRMGLAAGSGSHVQNANRAVQRDASEKRGDVLQDYSANFLELDKNKRRGEEDFQRLLRDLNAMRSEREGGARGDIEAQRNQIRENMARVAGERARLLGGGYAGVRSAMAPYEAQIRDGESVIDNIFNKYATKYNVNPVQEYRTNLRDYMVDQTAVRDNAATGNQNDYAPYRPPFEDEEEQQPLV